MKVLETVFNGVLFRSRLEARWAIFFHELRIPYVYEPDGYDLDGLFYCPDFWLSDQKLFVEIKPESPEHNGQEMEKARRLAAFTKRAVVIEVGAPMLLNCANGAGFPCMIFGSGGEDYSYLWCECPQCGRLDIQFDGRADRIKCNCAKSEHGDKGYNYDTEKLRKAYTAAQRFRFWNPTQEAKSA